MANALPSHPTIAALEWIARFEADGIKTTFEGLRLMTLCAGLWTTIQPLLHHQSSEHFNPHHAEWQCALGILKGALTATEGVAQACAGPLALCAAYRTGEFVLRQLF